MIRNEVCPECRHHMLSHVLYGPHGHGCQELIGEVDCGLASCNCLHYERELSKPFLVIDELLANNQKEVKP